MNKSIVEVALAEQVQFMESLQGKPVGEIVDSLQDVHEFMELVNDNADFQRFVKAARTSFAIERMLGADIMSSTIAQAMLAGIAIQKAEQASQDLEKLMGGTPGVEASL